MRNQPVNSIFESDDNQQLITDLTTTTQTEMVQITPNRAIQMLNEHHYPRQRRIRASTVEFYTNEILRGAFLQDTNISFAVLPDGSKYMTNGYHRLRSLIASGVPQSFTMTTRFVNTMTQVDEIYYREDRGLVRTSGDAQVALNTQINIPKTQKGRFSAAIRVLMSGFQRTVATTKQRVGDDVLAAAMEEWAEPAEAYYNAIYDGDATLTSRMASAPVMAVALITFASSPNRAAEFWHDISQNNELKNGSPQHTLVHLLFTHKVSSQGVALYARKTASCWNMWYTKPGASYKSACGNVKKPIQIAGSARYNGKDVVSYYPARFQSQRPIQSAQG